MRNRDPYGLTYKAGGPHHRAYVGPPHDYDLVAGLVFSLLIAAGMRETNRVLDVGCGSLRVGRLLVPFLRPGGYYGLEPNRWLVKEGVRRELGRWMRRRKQPRFHYADDFSADAFGVQFDWIVAQSIFSHTYPDLTVTGLTRLVPTLTDGGVMLATFVEGDTIDGSGWRYPQCVEYQWEDMQAILSQAGLAAEPISWPHPRQRWFIAARPPQKRRLTVLADRLRLGTDGWKP
ncbi:MAG: hypothetical protein GEU71_17535 [Actinobacteria bacterium]|nr:hypothetical protein [Actinomycetota bacterium]